jgi:antitoxin (DNA-binding transcriptional repressor) of toxin-antitoxin stability system
MQRVWAFSGGAGRCITCDTMCRMAQVGIRDLRNHGGDVVDRAARGEQITITRSGRAVAELRAIAPPALSAAALLDRWRRLPPVDPVAFREDVDRLVDASL